MNKAQTYQDRLFDLKKLQEVSCLSVRTLRDHLKDPVNPLPSFKVGGKILVKWSEFNQWLEISRVTGQDLNDIVNEITGDLS